MKARSRKLLSFLLALSMLLTLAPAALASEALGDDLDARTQTLHRGVELAEGTFWSNAYSDLRRENYVVYSPNETVTPIITFGASVTERTTAASAAAALEAQGYRVVAGINGDYYGANNGVPMGSVISEGELRVAAASNYAIGFRTDGTAILGAPELSVTVESEHGSFAVSSMNQVRYSHGGIYLYSDEFNARGTTGTNAAGYDLVCSVADGRMSIGETLTLTVDEILPEAIDTVVPEGKYILTANLLSGEENLALLRGFSVGDTLTVTVSAASEAWNDVEYAIGALYQLVADGEVCTGLEPGAAPRTAIGQRADGSIIFYTIDGRQSGYSIGASLTQVAERMVELGCVTALSLDGGGSTTLSVTLPESTGVSVYNSPSEGALRAVTNHIFLVASNEPSGTLDHISLRAESGHVLAGAQVRLYAAAIDTNYLPMERSVSLASDRGSVGVNEAGENILTAPAAAGSVTVGAKVGGKYAAAALNVIASPERIELRCDGTAGSFLLLAPGQSVSLEARAYEGHLRLLAQNHCFTWSVDGGIGTVDENGLFTAADHVAYGTLTVSAGETVLTVPVHVSADPNVLLDGFETAPEVFAHNTDKAFVRFGSASARWDYAVETLSEEEGEALVLAPQSYRIPDGYERLSLWVYGDGSGAQLSLLTCSGADDTAAAETDAVTLDFTGWQQLSFDVSGAWMAAGFALRPAEQTSGTLYFDQLTASRALAVADTAAPEITLTLSEDGMALTGKVFDAVDGGTLTTLRVTLDGKAIAYTYDHQTGALHVSLPMGDGKAHRITVIAGDASGNLSRAGVDLIPQELAPAFTDTASHWANAAVSYLKANGITNGDGQSRYNPDSNITREEFAALLCRSLAGTEDFSAVDLPFADSADISPWAVESVRAMYALGITQGSRDLSGKLRFSPKATITRQEVLTMLGRLLELGYAAPEWSFTDSDAIADWARSHVNTLYAIGAVSGYSDGGIHPTDPITRAQVASLLFRLS